MVSVINQYESAIGIHVFPPSWTSLTIPPHPIPLGLHRAPALGALLHASNSHRLSILHMVMYMFQCYCFKLSHPLLLLSPKVCSLHLCSLCCPICRIIDKDYSYVWSLPLKKKLPIQGYHIHFKLQNHIWGSNNLELLLNQLLKMSLQTIILSYFNFQFSSVTQPCPTLCIPMDCSTPGFPVHHQLPELAPTHVHWVHDATQPSRLLSSPFPPALIFPNIRVFSNQSVLRYQLAKVLELQHQSFKRIFRTDFL